MAVEINHGDTKVALFSDAPYMGGAERYLVLLAAAMRDCGFEPVLIVGGGGRLGTLKEIMMEGGIDVFDVSHGKGWTAAESLEAFRLFKSLGCSILHLNLPGPFDARYSLIAPLARMAGIRNVVSTEHLPMVPAFAKARILKGFSTRFIKRVITVSRNNVQYLIENHHVPPAKIRVVYNGIPDSGGAEPIHLKGELGLAEESCLVAVVGMLTERKGQATLFGAMKRLSRNVHLVVVGSGPLEEDYRRVVSRLSIGDRVHFTGFRPDVSSLLRGIDILAVPSLMEATPYVILEAMAAGVPVVASGIYGIPEQVVSGETGLLVEPGDEQGFASAIQELASDPLRAKSMGEKGRRRYEERFTVRDFARGTLDVYRELIEGGCT